MRMVKILPSLYVTDVEIAFKVAEEPAEASGNGGDRPGSPADLS